MPRLSRGLTAAEVAVLVNKPKPGRYSDGDGLHLTVRENGAWWTLRYRHNGKMREPGLGRAKGKGALSLAQARNKARPLWAAHKDGADPLGDKLANRQNNAATSITFRQQAEAYVANHAAGWRSERHAAQWVESLENHVYPKLGNLQVKDITNAHILRVLKPIWETKTETASRVRGRIQLVLGMAKANGVFSHDNPALWSALSHSLPKPSKAKGMVKHFAALPYPELPAFFAALKREGASQMLAFAILTAARTGEVIGATWAEIDMADATWTIAAERMKAGRPHRVALSPAALDILSAQHAQWVGVNGEPPSPSAPVFTRHPQTELPYSDMAMLKVMQRMGVGQYTVHGFRSTFKDWSAERTHYPSEVAEMALAHAVGNRVEAAYRRGDLLERRQRLMHEWSEFCLKGEPASGKVIALR